MYLGIDVGGTKIAAALVRKDGALEKRVHEPVDHSDERSALKQVLRIVGSMPCHDCLGVGVAIPGIADRKTRTVWAPNLKGWDHLPLEEEIARVSPCPVTVESDRNAAILGELLFGAARGKQDVVFVILGTGIGAGIVSGGRLIRGAHDIAGAVGWIPVAWSGGVEHWERLAAGPGIEALGASALGRTLSLPELASEARGGNRDARAVFETAGELVGQALSVLVDVLDPELIVLGGGVSNCWELMETAAVRALKRWAQPIGVEKVKLVVSFLGENAGILGAAAVAGWAEQEPASREQ